MHYICFQSAALEAMGSVPMTEIKDPNVRAKMADSEFGFNTYEKWL